jgi:PKD repeat protein
MHCARAAVVLLVAAALVAGAGQAQTILTTQNPSFSFSTPGQKQVALKACNNQGCSTVLQTVTVLDPTPVITQAQVGATTVEAGQLVKLVGAGHGQPPLSYTWRITRVAQPEIDILGAGVWWNTTGVPPGTYTVLLHLQNAVSFAESTPVTVVVAAPTPKSFYTVTPCRLLDTRQSSALHSGTQLTFPVAGITAFACGIPALASAISANVTVVSPSGGGFVALYPGNYPNPPISTVSFSAGQIRSNNAILPLASDGSGTLAAQPFVLANGSVQLIVDVNGYFM